jgi:hypothetical protein
MAVDLLSLANLDFAVVGIFDIRYDYVGHVEVQISYAAGIKIRSKPDGIEGLKAKVGYVEVSDKVSCLYLITWFALVLQQLSRVVEIDL